MTHPIEAAVAVIDTVLSIGSIWALDLTSITHPSRVAVGAFAIDAVAEVSVFTGWANVLAVFTKEPRSTRLVTPCAIPTAFTCDAMSLCHHAGLLAFAVTTPVSAILSVESSWTRLPAELPSESWLAGARSIRRVTASIETLALVLAVSTPQTLSTLAAAAELVTWRGVAGTLGTAVPPIPARIAVALACSHITHRVYSAETVVRALRAPIACVARTSACLLVALALLAAAGSLTVWPPAIRVTGAGPSDIIAPPVGMAITLTLAVRPPELERTFHITSGSKITMTTAAFVGSHTNFILFAGEVTLTNWY